MILRLTGAVFLSAVALILWAISSPTTTIKPLVTTSSNIIVTRVLDGDTIVIAGGEKVRYIGMDTPELYGNNNSNDCFAQEAKKRNEQLVLGKTVRLRKDVSNVDKYGRLLRYVYVGNSTSSVNELLVDEGFAHATPYPPNIAMEARLIKLEKYAKENKLGLWNACR